MAIVKGNGAASGNKIQDSAKTTKISVEDISGKIEMTTGGSSRVTVDGSVDSVVTVSAPVSGIAN